MIDLADLMFRYGEQDTIRVPKLNDLTSYVQAATVVTTDPTIVALMALDASAGVLVQTAADTFVKRTLTAPAAGITITNPAGTAGNPTLVLANDLAALEALASSGFAARTGTDTWAIRTLSAPAAGFSIANPAGTAGDPTFALTNDLAALEGLASTGFAARTGTDAWAQRTLTAPAAGLTITNPAGIAGNPTFAFANDLAALEALSGTNTIYYRSGVDTWSAVTIGSLLSFSAGSLNIGSTTGTGTTVVLSASPTFTGTVNAAAITASGAVSGGSFKIGAVTLVDATGGANGYHEFHTPSANTALHLGGSTDPTNYYSNTTHQFRSLTGTSFATVNSTGLTVVGTIACGPLNASGAATTGALTTTGLHIINKTGEAVRMVGDGFYFQFYDTALNSLGFFQIVDDGTTGTFTLAPTSGVVDVTGQARCDSLRIDQTPVAATPVPTHTFTINLNGTTYRIPCVI